MSIIMRPNPPTNARPGTIYVDDNTNEMRLWDGAQWHRIGGRANAMSNTYMGFSEEIEKLSPEEIKWVHSFLAEYEPEDEKEEDVWCAARGLDPKTFDDYDRENWPGFSYRIEKGSNNLWLYCDEGFNPDTLAHFVQQFLKKWRPYYVFKMTYASWCDKPMVGAFGGGWMAISAYACIDSGCHSAVELAAKQLQARVELEIQSKVEAVSGKRM